MSTKNSRMRFARGDIIAETASIATWPRRYGGGRHEDRADDQEDRELILPVGGEMEEIAGGNTVGEDKRSDDQRERCDERDDVIDRRHEAFKAGGVRFRGHRLACGPDAVEAVNHGAGLSRQETFTPSASFSNSADSAVF